MPAAIPDTPGLEGLDERWSARWEADRRLPVRPDRGARHVFSIDTPPPTVSGSLHMGHVFGYTQTDTVARYQRMRGTRSSTRWAGTTTACRPSAACRTTTASAATRTCRTTPTFAPPARPRQGHADADLAAATSSSCATRLTVEDEQAFEAAVAPPRPLGRLVADLHDDRRRARSGASPARVPAQPRTRRGLPGRGADAVGRRLPHRRRAGRARRPRACRARTTALAFHAADGAGDRADRHDAARAAARVRRARRAPRRRALPAAVRHRRRDAAVRRRVPVVAHHLADPEKGTGIAMICTFGDTTDVVVVARAAAARRARSSGATAGSTPTPPAGVTSDGGARAYAELAGKTVKQAQKIDRRAAAASRASSIGEPRPITHPVKFYEKGDRPLEIVTTPPVVHPQRRARRRRCATRCSARGSELHWHPPYMRARYENWVEGPQRRLAASAASASSACRSRSGTRSTPTASPMYDEPIVARRGQLPVDPSTDVPAGLSPRRSAASRAASPATPT